MLRKFGERGALILLLLAIGLLGTGNAWAYPAPGAESDADPRPLSLEIVPPAVRDGTARRLGAHPANAPLHLLFMLPLRDWAGLDAFLTDVGNPRSPNYGHYLTLEQANARFNPDPAREARVLAWLRANQITDLRTPPNHLYVDAKGTTAAFSALLSVPIGDYQAADRRFYGPDRPPVLPAALAADVTWIAGLSNEIQLRRFANGTPHGAPPYYPQDLANAYNVNPLWEAGFTGASSSLAITLWGAPPSDDTLNAWGGATGAAVATQANGRLVVIPEDGGSTLEDDGEAGMDIESSGGIAYNAQIRYYEAATDGNGNPVITSVANAVNHAGTDSVNNGMISNSWGGAEVAGLTSLLEPILAANAATGHTYLFSSGDNGSWAQGTDPYPAYPASSRYVLSIGGTRFSSNIGSGWPGEEAWLYDPTGNQGSPEGSGGGYSLAFGRPDWQAAPGFSNTHRGYPDVSAVGDPATGFFVCFGNGGTCGQIGGTSLSAPVWAGLLTLVNQYLAAQGQPPLGFAPPALYNLANSSPQFAPYHDITSGTNGAYNAGAGWDAVTGLGSPDIWNLARALGGSGATATPTATPTATVTGVGDTPTTTPTGPTPTPTATIVLCPSGFSDVPVGSPFYTVITDLVARGAISGYRDCTFRPNNTITRGQVAKVLVLGFGFEVVTPETARFSDVPVGSPFFAFVETAAAHSIISGYGDGTFRPNNEITRGQLAKMVTTSSTWPVIDPATPSFNDVPRGSVFYTFIETAYSKGVISGYGCGANCRQFRPAGTATRGQGAKVIDLAILTIPTATPTESPTATPSETPVEGTPTDTATPTMTEVPPATDTPTETTTPTETPTPTVTRTPRYTVTPTPVPSDTPQPPPEILSFDPAMVEQYDTSTQVTMTGHWFGLIQGSGFVAVNSRLASVDSWSNTLIRFRINAATPPGDPIIVRLVRDDGLATESTLFSVGPRRRPYVFSYAPSSLIQGDSETIVTIQGMRFGTTPGTITLLGIYTATIISWTDTAIGFRMAPNTPAGRPNPISVTIRAPDTGEYKEFGLFAVLPRQ